MLRSCANPESKTARRVLCEDDRGRDGVRRGGLRPPPQAWFCPWEPRGALWAETSRSLSPAPTLLEKRVVRPCFNDFSFVFHLPFLSWLIETHVLF